MKCRRCDTEFFYDEATIHIKLKEDVRSTVKIPIIENGTAVIEFCVNCLQSFYQSNIDALSDEEREIVIADFMQNSKGITVVPKGKI